jgi:hypothetical protein
VYKQNRAVVLAGGDHGPVFSATGQLPTNIAALESIRGKREAVAQVSGALVAAEQEVSFYFTNVLIQ